ncbi:MAG TPA: SBBP repeat-containing protein [Terriglobia bacterium]|nr:SBBP repeat-containing protein [Terriglobia bacterium]
MRFEPARWAGVLWAAVWLTGCGARTGNSPKQTATTPSAVRTQDLRVNHAPSSGGSGVPSQARLITTYGQLPRRFEANQGQTNQEVKFLSRGQGYSLFLTDREAVLMLRGHQPSVASRQFPITLDDNQSLPSRTRQLSGLLEPPAPFDPHPSIRRSADNRQSAANAKVSQAAFHMKLVGANPTAKVMGLDELPGKSNYFIGNDPKKWRTNVPNYTKVKYKNVYPGVDLIYYGNQQQLEYDFVVSPGADPRAIQLRFDGVDKLNLNAQGHLNLHVTGGGVVEHVPAMYQETKRGRRNVSGEFELRGNSQVGFRVASYDATRPLVIDPLVSSYSTFLGGSSTDEGYSIAVDASGNAYVAGVTNSVDFPTANGFQPPPPGQSAFVTKLNPSGSALVYSTYISNAGPGGIAIDSSGNAYITGGASPNAFPTTLGAFQTTSPSTQPAFVAKINAMGNALLYSTYLGGGRSDLGYGIAVDNSGDAYVTGLTCSSDFPTKNPFQSVIGGGSSATPLCDAFVTKMNPSGSALVYSTYLGGSDNDVGTSIAVDSSGGAYLTGYTYSTNFPTMNALRSSPSGATDAFVTKLDPSGSALVYSTYLGGSNDDEGHGIALDSSGAAYITGNTYSLDYPTLNPFQPSGLGPDSPFVTKLSPAGNSLVYSSYLNPGGAFDLGTGIAVDSLGSAYVTADVSNPHYRAGNVLLAKVNPAGSAISDFTIIGGSVFEISSGVAVDGFGNAYLTGLTYSSDFPTANSLQSTFMGSGDAFITKISESTDYPLPALTTLSQTSALAGGTDLTLGVNGSNFDPSSVVRWNGSDRTTTFRRTDLLSVIIPAGDIIAAGTDAVTVFNPSPRGGTSNSLTFTVVQPNPIPIATALSPAGANPGSAGFTLTVSGSNFVSNSVVRWNQGDRQTTFVSSNQLQAAITAADVASSGTAQVTVFNPSPSGGTSNIVNFTISSGPAVTLSPLTLSFATQVVTTNSANQTETLTNSGNGTLTISSVAVSGDFTETNTCGASLAPTTSCTVSVAFKSVAGGSRTGTLTINDNAPGTPQTVSLQGQGADFSVSAMPSAQTLTAGQATTYTVNLTPAGGLDFPVALACSGAPSLSTCTITPNSVTPDGTNPATASVTVTTTAGTLGAPEPKVGPSTTGGNDVRLSPLWLLALATLSAAAAIRRCRPAIVLALTMLFMLSLDSCGGGDTSVTHKPGTPAGTYTLTFTGTYQNLSHTTMATLTVNP